MADFSVKMLLTAALLVSAPSQSGDSLETTIKRFYLADGMTLINGFAEVAFASLQTLEGSEPPVAAYRIDVNVLDSEGSTLNASSWTGMVPERLTGLPDASTVEHFTFVVPEGSYIVEISLTD